MGAAVFIANHVHCDARMTAIAASTSPRVLIVQELTGDDLAPFAISGCEGSLRGGGHLLSRPPSGSVLAAETAAAAHFARPRPKMASWAEQAYEVVHPPLATSRCAV